MDKRVKKGVETRQKILSATKNILNERGLKALTTRGISEKAGISQSCLYHHFKDYEDILFTAISNALKDLFDYREINNYNNLSDYLISLLECSEPKNKGKESKKGFFSIFEKAFLDENFKTKLVLLCKEQLDDFKKKIKEVFGKDINDKKLDLIIFGFIALRDGLNIHTQFFQKSSPFFEPKEIVGEILKLVEDNLESKASKTN